MFYQDPNLPRLTPANNVVTSKPTDRYNCIAWAARDDKHWWEPSGRPEHYWPNPTTGSTALQELISAYEAHGFEQCLAGAAQPGYELIAVYVDQQGNFKHAARRENGGWTSKLGRYIDIWHATERDVECATYGTVAGYLRRPDPDLVQVLLDHLCNITLLLCSLHDAASEEPEVEPRSSAG